MSTTTVLVSAVGNTTDPLMECQNLVNSGHSINLVFLFQDAVHLPYELNATQLVTWREFTLSIPILVCTTALHRRDLSQADLPHPFTGAGLGQWAQAMFDSSELINLR